MSQFGISPNGEDETIDWRQLKGCRPRSIVDGGHPYQLKVISMYMTATMSAIRAMPVTHNNVMFNVLSMV